MIKTLKWSLLALLAYVFFLIAYLPAKQILNWFELPQSVSLYGVSGTVWQGRATQFNYKGIGLDNVRWKIRVLPLLWANLALEIDAGNNRDKDAIAVAGNMGFSLTNNQRISVDDLTAYLPAAQLVQHLPLPLPVDALGRFKVVLNELDYNQGCLALNGKGNWLNAAIQLPKRAVPLGNFRANLACKDNNIVLSIAEPNRLGLTAEVLLTPAGKANINGRFKLDPQLPSEFHQGTTLFGQPDNQGYRTVKF